MSGRDFPLTIHWLPGLFLGALLTTSATAANKPSVSQALELKPLQAGIDFDTPAQRRNREMQHQIGGSRRRFRLGRAQCGRAGPTSLPRHQQ